MTEAFQAAVDLAGHGACGVVESVEYVADCAALRRDVQILHGDELGYREAIVHLDQVDLMTRHVDPGLVIGALGRYACGGEIAAVPGVVLCLLAVRYRELERLHGDEIALAEAFGDIRRGDDRACRAVADAAAVVKPERLGDHRRL